MSDWIDMTFDGRGDNLGVRWPSAGFNIGDETRECRCDGGVGGSLFRPRRALSEYACSRAWMNWPCVDLGISAAFLERNDSRIAWLTHSVQCEPLGAMWMSA